MSAKNIIGSIIILVFMVWGTMTFLETTVQYVSISSARNSQTKVQVMGKIDFDVVEYNADLSRLEFAVYDAEAEQMEGAERIDVVYYGVVPGNFDQAKSVVLKGKTQDNLFVADEMLIKCPSKYQGDESEEYQDIQKHNDAVETEGTT